MMKFSIGADIGRRGEKLRSRTDRRKEIVVLLCSDKTAGESFVKNVVITLRDGDCTVVVMETYRIS